MRRWRLQLLLVVCGVAAQYAGAQQTSTVFQIGSFDRSSLEFGSGPAAAPVRYVVGQSTLKQWPASQAVQAHGSKNAAQRTVAFTLTGAPARAYRLRLAVLLETASVPELAATVNGRNGRFALQPVLDYSNGDQGDSFYPAYARAEVVFDLPGAWLHAGENTLTFTAVSPDAQTVPDAALTWDALALQRVDAWQHAEPARVEPSIFYHRSGAALTEDVDVYVPHVAPLNTVHPVELRLGDAHYAQPAGSAATFGVARFIFPVAPFAPGTEARVHWRAGSHEEQTEQTVTPAKQWTLYLVPHIHVDVGYSDYQAKIADIQAESIDEAMQMTAAHPEFRFSLDGEWDLEQFLETRTPEDQQRALAAIRAQTLFLPAQYANLLTGFPTAETLIRSLYPSANYSREHDTPFNYANLTDVPSYSWSYASILAASGIHVLAGGSNNYRAPVLLQGRLNEDSPFYWEGPDGGRVLLWYSRIYQQMQMLFGLPPVPDAGRDTLPLFLQQYEHTGYKAHAVLLYGSQVENTDLFPQQAELAEQWNRRYAFPRMEYSGFYHALTTIAQQFGDNAIPTIRGDGGPYWEDGIASDAKYAAMERETEPRALTAEKLDTLSTFVDPKLAADTTRLRRLWQNMVLMDEHTWDAYDSISSPTSDEAVDQLAIKDQYAVRAAAQADFVTRNSMANLARSVPGGAGSLIVWNLLNWPRSGPVELDLPDGWQIADASTNEPIGTETVRTGEGFRHVRFASRDVPAMGYRRYVEEPANGEAATDAPLHTTTLENTYYRVTLDPGAGAIRSIYDKQLGRELVDAAGPYRFGQYLYVTGGDTAPNTLLQYSHVAPTPQLTVHAAGSGQLLSVTRTPYGEVARLESSTVNTPSIVTEVRLFNDAKKIELVESVQKQAVTAKEGVYFAFPLAMPQPQFQYEIQNGVVDPAKDMYPGAGHVWFSVQHWVAAQQGGVSVAVLPLDASLVTLGDINRGQWPETFGQRQGSIFSYVMNNYWDTNYRAAQGGSFRFRYVVTSAPQTDDVALSRLGWEEATPLEVDTVTTQDKALPTPAGPGDVPQGFIQEDDPALLFETWKHAEDGRGTILRFLDLGGAARTVTVRMPSVSLAGAWQTDAVERDQQPLPVEGGNTLHIHVTPHAIVSVRIVPR